MARPPVDINAEQVLKLAKLGCKTNEIAEYFGVSHDTITRRFASELEKGRAEIKLSLRQAQLRNAIENNNVQMQIWLGKQMLGQEEKTRIDIARVSDEEFIEEAKRRLLTDESTTQGSSQEPTPDEGIEPDNSDRPEIQSTG